MHFRCILGLTECRNQNLTEGLNHGTFTDQMFLSLSLDRARASRDNFFFVSEVSLIVAQRDEYFAAH